MLIDWKHLKIADKTLAVFGSFKSYTWKDVEIRADQKYVSLVMGDNGANEENQLFKFIEISSRASNMVRTNQSNINKKTVSLFIILSMNVYR